MDESAQQYGFGAQGEPRTDVSDFLRLVFDADPREVRIPNCPERKGGAFTSVHSGYFTDARTAAEAIERVEILEPPGTYILLNPCTPDVVARAANRIKSKAKNTTTDAEITCLRLLLVDVDPVRPAGVSSTVDEMQAAIEVADACRQALEVEGWPAPIVGMSGNGAYLLWKLDDLPTSDSELLRRVLLGLKARFDTNRATIDEKTFNPSRIAKVLGTVARKGDHTEDRPHRRSWFIAPEHELTPVSRELLEGVAIKPGGSGVEKLPPPKRNGRPSAVERCKLYLEKMPPSIEGQNGSDPCFAAACVIWKFTAHEGEAMELLQHFNAAKCNPPWSEGELRHKLADARKRVESDGELLSMANQQQSRVVGKTAEGKPRIAVCDDLKKMTEATWEALEQYNQPTARLFRYGGLPARLEHDDDGNLIVSTLEINGMRYALVEAVEWVKRVQKGEEWEERATSPTDKLVKNVLATPDKPLPILTRVVQAPVFAMDGSLQLAPGYHAQGKVYYKPKAGFAVPPVPERPSDTEVAKARSLICDDLLVDFPFVGESEVAHAVAFMLLPFARDLIHGPTPFHLFEKPSPGTGASLMVEMLAYPMLGAAVKVGAEVRSEGEMRKRITATLMKSPAYFLLDNLNRLDSASLSAALTSLTWEDRELQYSRTVAVPVRCVWTGTGNNPVVSQEIARRTIRCRLDAKQDKPWERTGFKHENLRRWVAENRGVLVWAALTLIRAWLSAGRPEPGKTLGSYTEWAHVIGGTLMVAGINGFLGNVTEFYDASDAESEAWRSFLADWWSEKCSHDVKTGDLLPLAIRNGVNLGDKEGHGQSVKLGSMIRRYVETVFDVPGGELETLQLMVEKGDKNKRAQVWRLVELTKTAF
ncbi:MAG: hypothetical protein RIC55_35885 [Pirellulaceae bacterium]